jgi:hypothetical protein
MKAVGWLGVVVVGAVLLLARAEGADECRVAAADTEVEALRGRIAALEARLKVLEGVVQISGPSIKLVSAAGMTIQAGTSIAIQGGAGVSIQGASGVDVRGALIQLNNGGRPFARVGDSVVVGGRLGQITTGSPTVLGQ